LSAEQAEKVRNAKEVFDTFRDSVQKLTDWNPVSKFAHGISNQLVDSAVKRTADSLEYATDSYAEAAYVGAGSVAGENAPYIGSLERLATGERINDETGRVEKTSTTQKVIDAVSLGLDVAAMVPGKGKAFSTLVDKVKGVFGKGAASVGDDVIAAGARAGGEAAETPLKYHYTTAEEASFKGGLWRDTSVTDKLYTDPLKASQELGIPVPNKAIPIKDAGQFVPNKPPIVQPSYRYQGGGTDFINPEPVPPENLLPAKPLWGG
jgi:hypothetical protein